MPVRPIAAGDGETVRRLWDDLGGWYRNTSPSSDEDVDRAIRRLQRHPTSSRRRRRGGTAEAGWVFESSGRVAAWLYARADPEQNYVVPLVPPEDAHGALDGLLDAAHQWFRQEQVERFVVDVPAGRPDLRTAAQQQGRPLWHRAILDRDLSPFPSGSPDGGTVRDFRRADLANVQVLFDRRHPDRPTAPVPVAFLQLRSGWFGDPASELQRAILIAGPREQLLGVAGGTHRSNAPIGFLGPWVLSENAGAAVALDLLGGVSEWLRGVGAQRVRTTVPTPPGDDAQMLLRAGFATLAEGDLFEIRS
jgi:hypothetical protein